MKKLYLLLLVALCGAMISPAVAKKKNKKKASTEATTKKEKKETKYDKLFKDKKVTTAKGFSTGASYRLPLLMRKCVMLFCVKTYWEIVSLMCSRMR